MIFRRRPKTDSQGSLVREVPTGLARKHEVEGAIPVGVEIAGQWAWRILAIVAVIVVFGIAVIQVRDIVIPLLIALLLASLLVPFKNMLMRHRWPKWLAVLVSLLLTFGVIGGLITLVVFQVRGGLGDVITRTEEQFDVLLKFLAGAPFNLDESQIRDGVTKAIDDITKDSSTLLNGALSVGSTAGHVLEGLFVVFFTTLFVLIDGRGIWAWIVRLFPRKARRAVSGAGRAGWVTLTTFVRVQIFVAFVDAVGIGVGAWVIGLTFGGFPLVIPIAVLVFLASFIPVIGAIVSGAVAVFIALVYGGPVPAIVMLGVVLLVQQIEGHVLQPLVMGTAVKVHPLAVVLSVTAFSGIAGIPGALFAVPLVATLNVMVKYISSGRWRVDSTPGLKDVAATTDTVER
jgi:predicted PurR-regulated permease PerM